jgi:hypothetical protein
MNGDDNSFWLPHRAEMRTRRKKELAADASGDVNAAGSSRSSRKLGVKREKPLFFPTSLTPESDVPKVRPPCEGCSHEPHSQVVLVVWAVSAQGPPCTRPVHARCHELQPDRRHRPASRASQLGAQLESELIAHLPASALERTQVDGAPGVASDDRVMVFLDGRPWHGSRCERRGAPFSSLQQVSAVRLGLVV